MTSINPRVLLLLLRVKILMVIVVLLYVLELKPVSSFIHSSNMMCCSFRKQAVSSNQLQLQLKLQLRTTHMSMIQQQSTRRRKRTKTYLKSSLNSEIFFERQKQKSKDPDLDPDRDLDRSYMPPSIQISLETHGHKYYCNKCAVGFKKQKNFQQHVLGKKHCRVVDEWASAREDYALDAPTWCHHNNDHDDDNIDIDIDIDIDVCTPWNKSEMQNFPHRHSCIDPSLKISTLTPPLRARFWRYLRDEFGEHYPELASILHRVSVEGNGKCKGAQYMRVKELFESLEAFRIVSSVIIMAQDAAKLESKLESKLELELAGSSETDSSSSSCSANRTTRTGTSSKDNIDTIYDLACGHGLLGILLAYRFPTKKVICVDLEERESFHAFKAAFNELGESYKGASPLSNLEYREANLLTVQPELTPSSFVVALHACNEANKDVVDMARSVGVNAAWAVMPCCIRSKLYLGGASVLDLDSESRYKVLCGAFAEANGAQVVRAISRDITARPILIAGGW